MQDGRQWLEGNCYEWCSVYNSCYMFTQSIKCVILTGTMSWCPNNNHTTSCMYLYSDVDITCTTFLDIGLQQLSNLFKCNLPEYLWLITKKQQLVHIVKIVLEVFSKNIFALLKFIYFRSYPCHSNLVMETMSSIHWLGDIMNKQWNSRITCTLCLHYLFHLDV